MNCGDHERCGPSTIGKVVMNAGTHNSNVSYPSKGQIDDKLLSAFDVIHYARFFHAK